MTAVAAGSRAASRTVTGRELLRTLIERQLRLRAKRAALGMVWPCLAPLLLLALYTLVFHTVLHVPVRHYPEYLFAGLLPWTFLAQTLGASATCLASEPELIRRSRFPYELLPISAAAVFMVYFLLTLAGFVVYLAVQGRLTLAILPVLVLPVVAVFLFVTAVLMILSLVDVYNRDLRLVLGNLLTVWFFLVPIVYRPEMTHGWLRALRSVDPMNMIVGQFRDILYWRHLSRPGHLVLMTAVCVAFFGVTLVGFRRLSAELAKDV